MAFTAHVVLVFAFLLRFIDIADQCIGSIDVPSYSVMIFGIPSMAAFLAESALSAMFNVGVGIMFIIVACEEAFKEKEM